ncbi:cobalt-precorrin-5B (C(1))-methyltransferase CbiD [Vulcanisaeta distributa]|uniref:Cobalt-precorrin-5B C(1)-methyltransferase n=1 Tax=Vulcanisaeta distributa (strain DSM 14429 / JCM 11212 / NBRC 100878 / IC-017) TaxID=572478 RepID=E1QNJ6_VULDI|nr:cobalt-precorrin-5B (C(1))-methyltransferase CbiD [Vulcanisaeta distributa]ADN51284.1 cobalamin biosynthesis protein CbiD [Vulcanisaeta distributa DSM 14429]
MSVIDYFKRFGITTGAAAAAAAKAAVMALIKGVTPNSVTIPTPVGLRLEVAVDRVFTEGGYVCADVRKIAGDNPDKLDNAVIRACVHPIGEGTIRIVGGRGVGKVVRPGLSIPMGESAISPTAKLMIENAVREVVSSGVEVIIEVPNGEELARFTMNEDVGIIGGISILGTMGIEWPVSDESFIQHIKAQLMALRRDGDGVVIASGNRAVNFAKAIYDLSVVKVGDLVGASVREAIGLGFRKVVVALLPGKAVKLAAGLLNTHSSVGDARIETITWAAVMAGINGETLRRIASSKTVGEALHYLGNAAGKVMGIIAERALTRLRKLGNASLEIVIFSDNGEVLARVGDHE